MDEAIARQVLEANRQLASSGLVSLTWGNVSGRDPRSGHVAIKPSGIPYGSLTLDDLVWLDRSGSIVQGRMRPSSDTATHLELYRRFPGVGGIVHTHSRCATTLCQLGQELPVLGTTHADHFDGTVPMVRLLSLEETEADYELNTGRAIADHFERSGLDPLRVPGALQLHHGPFTWGKTVNAAFDNAIALEMCAEMALSTLMLGRPLVPIADHLLRKHQDRKHGPGATYGQDAT